MRLIDGDALKQTFCAECTHTLKCSDCDIDYHFEKLAPTIEERKMGKWIRHDEIKNVYGGICIECSECGEKYIVQHIEDEKYCRNCGSINGMER